MKTHFYVYEHWRPDRDECFYVGKGFGRRANVMYARNRHHTAIQAKLSRLGLCVEVRLVDSNLSEGDALALEIERISFWRESGVDLANLTAGGDGTSNPSDETRALMRAAKLGRTLTDEHKAKIGEKSRLILADPEMRKRLGSAIKAGLSTPEAKANRSAAMKARVLTEEHKAKIAAAHTGKKLSPEHAAKSRLASVGRKQTPEEIERRRTANSGRKRTAEFCERMRNRWTDELRSAQSIRTAEMNKKRYSNTPQDDGN